VSSEFAAAGALASTVDDLVYEIKRGLNKSGHHDLGPALGVRALNFVGGKVLPYKITGRKVNIDAGT
jgi:hypothetical protein